MKNVYSEAKIGEAGTHDINTRKASTEHGDWNTPAKPAMNM
jgi:hypothetical protein